MEKIGQKQSSDVNMISIGGWKEEVSMSDRDAKICPIADATRPRDPYIEPRRCRGAMCEWYDNVDGRCAIMTIMWLLKGWCR